MRRFFRNPEVLRLGAVLLALTAAAAAAGFLQSAGAGWTALGGCLAVAAAALGFQYWKYRQLIALAGYLRRIAGGEYGLDMRDNREGELSILKSEIHKVTTRLREYNEQLHRDRAVLADAMSDISHQLKTPLTSMMVMTDLLADDGLPPDKRVEFTEQICRQLERIRWLVTSLLKFSRLDIGAADLRRDRVAVRDAVVRAAEPLRVPMEERGHALVLDGGAEAAFTGDESWTAEALLNIMKNCVEHTPPGGTIAVRWSDNPIYTEILISDTGEGIAPEDLPRIFTRFYRGRNASPDSVGIGLAMAKSIVEQQNGTILVRSAPGNGTAFTIRFYKMIV